MRFRSQERWREYMVQRRHDADTMVVMATLKEWDVAWRRYAEGERSTVDGMMAEIRRICLEEHRLHLAPLDAVLEAMNETKEEMKRRGAWSSKEEERWADRVQMMAGMVLEHEQHTLLPARCVLAVNGDDEERVTEEWSRVRSLAEQQIVAAAAAEAARAEEMRHAWDHLSPKDRQGIMSLEEYLRKVLDERQDGWEENADGIEEELERKIGEAEGRYERAMGSKRAAQEERTRAEQQRTKLTQFYGGKSWEVHADRGKMPEYTAEVEFWKGLSGSVACT